MSDAVLVAVRVRVLDWTWLWDREPVFVNVTVDVNESCEYVRLGDALDPVGLVSVSSRVFLVLDTVT